MKNAYVGRSQGAPKPPSHLMLDIVNDCLHAGSPQKRAHWLELARLALDMVYGEEGEDPTNPQRQ